MNVVAIHSLKEDNLERATALAAALGVTEFEALARLRAPGCGPLVVAVFGELEPARKLLGRLHSGGFQAAIVTEEDMDAERGRLVVRKFEFRDKTLHVKLREGDCLDVPYRGIALILRGMGIALSASTDTVKTRSFSLGRAVLTGGLMPTKTTKTVRETMRQDREAFLILYSTGGPPLSFHENYLVYDSLDPALKPSRTANFNCLVVELRRRCEGASYDERLLTRAGQAALLGPRLSPETHLAVATALLSKVLRGRA